MAETPPFPEEPAVDLAGLSKRYGQRAVLRSLCLQIPRGEFLVLLGSNGAGKTTLLRILSTQLTPTSGSIRLFGSDPRAAGGAARSRIGLVTHGSFLYPELTVLENLRFYGQFYPVADTRYQDLLGIFGLLDYGSARAGSLSFGMRRRVDMVRALLHEPDLLLLDEPFAGLDETTARLLAGHLASLKENGTTLVMTSHAAKRAGLIADRVITLERGSIVQDVLHAA